MYDMHCHILPGVDDGASNLEEAIDMAIMAQESGIQSIFATPHYIEGAGYKDAVFNKEVLENLNLELSNRDIHIRILPGCEVYSAPDVLKLLEDGKIITLNNSNYMLVELPMHDIPMYIETMIYNLKVKGITPIIAHPERYTRIIEDPNILYTFISRGALAQLNLPSLLGMYGEGVKSTAEILLEHDMIHFVGTDAHKPNERFYKVREAINILDNLIGTDKTLKITELNPEAVAKGLNIEIDDPIPYKPKKKIVSFFSKLMGR